MNWELGRGGSKRGWWAQKNFYPLQCPLKEGEGKQVEGKNDPMCEISIAKSITLSKRWTLLNFKAILVSIFLYSKPFNTFLHLLFLIFIDSFIDQKKKNTLGEKNIS